MSRLVYPLLLYLLLPVALLRAWWRGRRSPVGSERLGERLGFVRPTDERPLLLHCVSVGETMAALPLIDALLARGERLWITSTTLTGAEQVRRRYGGRVRHSFMPIDTRGAVSRFLGRVRPRALLVMETEIWPNLVQACAQRAVPVLLVNARLSEKSARGYARVAVLTRDTLARFTLVAAQDEATAARFRALGAPRVEVLGNLKFDITPPTDDAVPAAWRGVTTGRKVWIAASTHAADEAVVLAAHAGLRKKLPALLLILVPRHPERFDAVAEAVQRAGFTCARRSRGAVPDAATAVYLADTMGELAMLYTDADVALVGGTFSGTGGHNFLEPAALGLPLVSGPSVYNFQSIADPLQACGALRCVRDAAGVVEVVAEWLQLPAAGAQAGAAGKNFVEANRGALARMLDVLARVL